MNITELKELAAKATPGPWFVVGQPWNPKADFIVAGSEDPHVGQYVADTEDFDGEGRNVQENAAYIAAANPAEILELIAQLEDAQGEIRALRATEAGLRERVKVLEFGLSEVETLMDESEGVAGLHLNGDVAPWSELRSGGRFEEWLLGFDEASALLEKKE